MHADIWKTLLKRVPVEKHCMLMAMTSAGSEINIQDVVRVEEDFFVVRGRMAGTTDTGKIYLLPFDGLDHMGFTKPVSDEDLAVLFSDGPTAAAAPVPVLAPAPLEAVGVNATAEQKPAVEGLPSPSDLTPAPMHRLPSKSKIIQRLRLRTSPPSGGAT